MAGGFMSGPMGFAATAFIGGAAKQANELFAEQRAQDRQDDIMQSQVWMNKFDNVEKERAAQNKAYATKQTLYKGILGASNNDPKIADAVMGYLEAFPDAGKDPTNIGILIKSYAAQGVKAEPGYQSEYLGNLKTQSQSDYERSQQFLNRMKPKYQGMLQSAPAWQPGQQVAQQGQGQQQQPMASPFETPDAPSMPTAAPATARQLPERSVPGTATTSDQLPGYPRTTAADRAYIKANPGQVLNTPESQNAPAAGEPIPLDTPQPQSSAAPQAPAYPSPTPQPQVPAAPQPTQQPPLVSSVTEGAPLTLGPQAPSGPLGPGEGFSSIRPNRQAQPSALPGAYSNRNAYYSALIAEGKQPKEAALLANGAETADVIEARKVNSYRLEHPNYDITPMQKKYGDDLTKQMEGVGAYAEASQNAQLGITLLTDQGMKTNAVQPMWDSINNLAVAVGIPELENKKIANPREAYNLFQKIQGRLQFGEISKYHLGRWTQMEVGLLGKQIASGTTEFSTNAKLLLLIKATADRVRDSMTEQSIAAGRGDSAGLEKAMNLRNQHALKYEGGTEVPWMRLDTNSNNAQQQAAALPKGTWFEDIHSGKMYYTGNKQ